jgi:hypothetical protein
MPEYEWLRQKSGIFHHYAYESDAPTAEIIRIERDIIFRALRRVHKYPVVSAIPHRGSRVLGWVDFALPPPESSTLPMEPSWEQIDWFSCLAGLVDEEIEDGMTATLGETISILLMFHGSDAIKDLKDLITSNKLSPTVVSHILRWIGRIKDSPSFDARLGLLCESLQSESPEVRDGASLGLAVLGSKKAIKALEKAIEREVLPGLRGDMQQVLRKLQN